MLHSWCLINQGHWRYRAANAGISNWLIVRVQRDFWLISSHGLRLIWNRWLYSIHNTYIANLVFVESLRSQRISWNSWNNTNLLVMLWIETISSINKSRRCRFSGYCCISGAFLCVKSLVKLVTHISHVISWDMIGGRLLPSSSSSSNLSFSWDTTLSSIIIIIIILLLLLLHISFIAPIIIIIILIHDEAAALRLLRFVEIVVSGRRWCC
mmetsp:Transcript_25159/g.40384  ORF Transcript_25159/g.40384 Transcript_25159/m.40384 type:complete len:211 (+) Transcript_25159:1017-1649(+)